MPRNGWTQQQALAGSKLWRSDAKVCDIAKAIGKRPQAIYSFARDNRNLFPKRTRGARKRKLSGPPLGPNGPLDPEEMVIVPSRTEPQLLRSIKLNEHLEREALKVGRPRSAESYRRAAEINRKELKALKASLEAEKTKKGKTEK